jgi:hypothetical protein
MELPLDILTDLLTDAELDALADEAERERREDAFLAALEKEREAGVVFVI